MKQKQFHWTAVYKPVSGLSFDAPAVFYDTVQTFGCFCITAFLTRIIFKQFRSLQWVLQIDIRKVLPNAIMESAL